MPVCVANRCVRRFTAPLAGRENKRILGILRRGFAQVLGELLEQLGNVQVDAIACAPGVPEQTRNKLQAALVALEQEAAGRELLSAIKIKGFTAADNDDWDDVRALGIDHLKPNATNQQ